MSVLTEILDWSMTLPAWQSDTIARLFTKDLLSADDIEDLYALLKVEHGIPDPKGRTADRLKAEQIPAPSPPEVLFRLIAIKNLRNVNKIAENQRLPFSPNGLTVIYGDNGSGKSGYSRVLKRACRARDQKEQIYPNAFLPSNPEAKAEATFEIEVNGKSEELGWRDGEMSPATLSTLAVFDYRCARSYLDDEGDFSYVPYGLDILEGLAGACKILKGKIDTELAVSSVDLTTFAHLAGETAVGKLLAGLSHKTKPMAVETLAKLTQEEEERHSTLAKSLKEGSPKEKAAQLKIKASRISRVVQNIEQKESAVNDVALTGLRKLVAEYRTAETAAGVVAKKFKEEANLLPGSGGAAWKELFDAAKRFAVKAYPDKAFSDLGPDELCPLCQQPLHDGAERLRRFEEFIQNQAEKTAQERKKLLDNAYAKFANQDLTVGIDEELREEIRALDNEALLDAEKYEKALLARQSAIKSAIEKAEWDKIEALPSNPAIKLNHLVKRLLRESETLEKLADEKKREALQKEFNELDARIGLAKVKTAVLAAIARLDRRDKLTKCLSAAKTNAISLKASELTNTVVSKELEDALNREFKELAVGNLQVCLKSRADRGKAYHKLKLDLPQAKTPADILSEGEQRAIALGSFLAEVNVSGSTGGIVLDDPVSSLDHKRRERVARRLVTEGRKRQVITFTHDIYFLNLLLSDAKNLEVPIEYYSVIRSPVGFGVTNPDLPFEGMNTKTRLGYLRNQHPKIKKLFESGDELEHRKQTVDAYRLLRIAWERAVEEVLLNQVVLRFRKGIETQRLSEVVVEDSDYKSVEHCMGKCSNYAHDQALLGGVELPHPDELLADINALDEWRKDIEKRKEQVRKKRKAAV